MNEAMNIEEEHNLFDERCEDVVSDDEMAEDGQKQLSKWSKTEVFEPY